MSRGVTNRENGLTVEFMFIYIASIVYKLVSGRYFVVPVVCFTAFDCYKGAPE